ncbi:hypothetical protein PM082_006162 [Marasmius tenuissimus]|nr:hypothetical protein PM082_006162 [Marasmius tenuissimus]
MPQKNQNTSHTVQNLKINYLAINPRCHTEPKPPPLTPEQRRAAAQTRAETKAKIETEIRIWLSDAKKKAEELAGQYNRSDRYFLDMMFQNSVHLTSPRKTNSYNTFKYFKAKENQEIGGKPLDVEDLDELYGDEYDKMSNKDKQDLVKKYEAEVSKEEREKIKISQPNARSRAQDVTHVVAVISAMLDALALRVGIEAMFMIVRNHHDPFMALTFGWTNEKLRDYMPLAVAGGWKTERVGTCCEAFAITGCDTSRMAKNKAEEALLLRNKITLIINNKLAEVLGIDEPAMEYVNFDKKMTYDRGVVCEGWPLPKFVKLSDIGSCTTTLRQVRDDWVEGRCRFRKLSPEEHVAWKKAHDEEVKNKEIEPKIRRTRQDAGTKRTKPHTASSETADVEMENVENEEDDGSVLDNDGGVQDGVGVAATIGDLGNADVEMEDGTSTSSPAASLSVKAAKAKKKASKSGANKAKEKKEKAEAAASTHWVQKKHNSRVTAQKQAKVQAKESATHPAPTAKACPKPQKKTRPADSGDAEPAIPPPIISPTESLPPPISESLPPPISKSPPPPIFELPPPPISELPPPPISASSNTPVAPELTEEDACVKALGESLKPQGIDGCDIGLIRSGKRDWHKPASFAAGAAFGS